MSKRKMANSVALWKLGGAGWVVPWTFYCCHVDRVMQVESKWFRESFFFFFGTTYKLNGGLNIEDGKNLRTWLSTDVLTQVQ